LIVAASIPKKLLLAFVRDDMVRDARGCDASVGATLAHHWWQSTRAIPASRMPFEKQLRHAAPPLFVVQKVVLWLSAAL
jgi:hypothetical protein